MSESVDRWASVLAAASSAAGAAAGLGWAAEALRLVWATEGAVRAATADGELSWLRLAEAVTAAADNFELIPGAPAVGFGVASRPLPAGPLSDAPALRRAVADLLAAVREALLRHADQHPSGAMALAAAVACRSVEQAVQAASRT